MKLGKTQIAMLAALKRHNGTWYNGCGWIWGTQSETSRLLGSLVKRGLVTVADEDFSKVWGERYKIPVYRLKENANG